MDTTPNTSHGSSALVRFESSEGQATIPEQQFFRHRWLKPLEGGRNTREIVGTQATEYDEDDELEDAEEYDGYPDSEDGEYDLEPSSANIKAEAKDITNSMSSVTEAGEPHPSTGGKKLIPWHRARVAEMLLLCIQYECFQAGINVPYEEAIQRLQPGSGGFNAMKQQFSKWRDQLVAEGHMVPPPLTAHSGRRQKGGDRTIRGFVRDMTSSNPTATKQLLWTEDWTHPKKSMSIPGVVRGSGNYMRQKKSQVDDEQVTKNYIVSEEDKEPPAKRRRPARSSAVSYATNSISEPDSGSEYDPSIKIESKGDKRSLRKGSRLRRSKTIHSKISKNHKFKAEGPLVTIKDGMAVVKLPSDALRALSPVVRDNAFQTPTHQVIPPYPGSEVGNDQALGFVSHDYGPLSIRSPLVDETHAFSSATDPFVANFGGSIAPARNYTTFAPANNTFDGLSIGNTYSFESPPAAPVYSSSYNIEDGSGMNYSNGLRYENTGHRLINGVSYYNGEELDMSFLCEHSIHQNPYFNRSTEGGFQQYFRFTDPHYLPDGNKENQQRGNTQAEIEEDLVLVGNPN